MGTAQPAAYAQPVISLRIKLSGPRPQALANLDRLLALVEELPSAEVVGELSLDAPPADLSADTVPDWPSYGNLLIRFGKRHASLSEQQGMVFEQIWKAKGELVPQRELAKLFPEDHDQNQQVHTNINRIRNVLKEHIPEVRIVRAGNGYYLAVQLD